MQHYYDSASSPSMRYTQSLPDLQHLSQSPPDHPHQLDAHRHPISHAAQTVSCLHQPNLTSHKSPNLGEQQRQMVGSDGYLKLSSHQEDELMYTLCQNLLSAHVSQSTQLQNQPFRSHDRKQGRSSHYGPQSHSRSSTLLHHQSQNFQPPPSVKEEHHSNISSPVVQPIFSHQNHVSCAQLSHERQFQQTTCQQQRPSKASLQYKTITAVLSHHRWDTHYVTHNPSGSHCRHLIVQVNYQDIIQT